MLNFIAKGVIGVTVMMWVRWTLPRLRIDQVMTTCLKYCVPIAAVMFLGATLWQYYWPNGVIFGIRRLAGRVRERWRAVAASRRQSRADRRLDGDAATSAHRTRASHGRNSVDGRTDQLAVVLLPAVRGDRLRVRRGRRA